MLKNVDPLLDSLQCIKEAGGTVFPEWKPESDIGFVYSAGGRELDPRDLQTLADRELLQRVFIDRLSLCPGCQSHHLNIREICVICKSSQIAAIELLHHYRCGYVAPAYEFSPERDGGRRCPKCHGVLRDRGSDHDVPGPQFVCSACSVSFQVPEIGLLCLSCGKHLYGGDLDKILYNDIYGYKLTSFGKNALHQGDAGDHDSGQTIDDVEYPMLRRSVFVAFVEDERKRKKRFHTTFSLLLLTVTPPQEAETTERMLLDEIVAKLTDVDKIARFDERRYMLLLPNMNERRALALAKALEGAQSGALKEWGVQAHVVTPREDGAWTDWVVAASAVAVVADA